MKKWFILPRYKDLFAISILFLISLTPFLWLKGNYLVLGHDSGIPLSPTPHFLDRLQTWTFRYDAGTDQTFALGGFFIHGFEALLNRLPLTLSVQQSVQFSVYIFLMGLAMYLFCRTVFPDDDRVIAITAAVFFQINHFVLQGWFIAERTKFSLYIALPLLLLLLYKLFTTRSSPITLASVSSLILFVLNGGGFLPLYASIFLCLGLWSIVFITLERDKKRGIQRILYYGITLGITSLLLQMYWLLPYAVYVKSNFQVEVAKSGGIDGVINWVKSISQNTSYLNLLRLQGIQEWYVNVEHPYAKYYFSNVLLVLASYCFIGVFLFAVLQLQKSKYKRQLVLLVSTILIALFFMAGSHPPFGSVYLFFIKHIPGFIAFRTPYYKFAPAFYVCFGPILGVFFYFVTSQKVLRKIPWLIKVSVPVVLLCLYFFPFFSSNFFQYTHHLSTKVSVPEYVTEYAQYSNSPDFPYKRILLLPGNSPENSVYSYAWGYWSLASLQSLLDRNAYISPSYGLSLEKKMVIDLYSALQSNNSNWEVLADHLHVDAILIQRDFTPYYYRGRLVDAGTFETALSDSKRVKVDRLFGQWELYSFESHAQAIAKQYIEVEDKTSQFGVASFLAKLFPENNIIFTDGKIDNAAVERRASVLFPECQDCLLQRTQSYFADSKVVFTPGSSLESLGHFMTFFSDKSQTASPVESLHTLYVLQASFNRKVESDARVSIWRVYFQQLARYSKELDTYLTQFDQTSQQNSVLQGYYNNLLFQLSQLKDMSKLVDKQEEAELFLESTALVKKMITSSESKLVSTQIIHKNIFLADVSVPGEYAMYVHTPSMNVSSNERQKRLQLRHNDENLQRDIDPTLDWQNIGTLFLDKGGQKLELEDVELDDSKYFPKEILDQSNKDEGYAVIVRSTQNCSKIPIGQLSSDRYNLSFEIKSGLGEFEPSFHVTYDEEKLPELPFWGITQKISDSSWKKIQIPFAATERKQYEFKICDSGAKEDRTVYLRKLKLDREVEPLIALVHEDTASVVSTPSGETKYSLPTNTHILVDSSSVTTGILRLPLPYSPNWEISNSQSRTIRTDGDLLGIVISDASDGQQFHTELQYKLQKYYKIGWTISAVSCLFIFLTLLFIHYSHAQKNT